MAKKGLLVVPIIHRDINLRLFSENVTERRSVNNNDNNNRMNINLQGRLEVPVGISDGLLLVFI